MLAAGPGRWRSHFCVCELDRHWECRLVYKYEVLCMNSGQIMLALATHATELPLSLIFLSDVFSVWWKKPLQLHLVIYFNNHLSCKCLKFKTTTDNALEGGKERSEEGREVGRKERWPQSCRFERNRGRVNIFWMGMISHWPIPVHFERETRWKSGDSQWKKEKRKVKRGISTRRRRRERDGSKENSERQEISGGSAVFIRGNMGYCVAGTRPGLYRQWATSLYSVPSCPSSSFYPRLDFSAFLFPPLHWLAFLLFASSWSRPPFFQPLVKQIEIMFM